MVQKKSNTVLNSGATQRVIKGQAYSGSYYDPFAYQQNQISLQFSNLSATDKRSRSVDFRNTLEALDFLVDRLGWEDLIDDYIFEKDIKSSWSPTYYTDIIVYFSLNKKKRWLLPDRLNLAVTVHNFMLQMSDLYDIDKKSKGFPTELWDLIASEMFTRNRKTRILRSRLIRDMADGMSSSGNAPQHWRKLIQFGLMDKFRCVDLNVSQEKYTFGCTLRGQARNKSDTTAPPVCERCADKSQRRNELKERKKKARTHARGIQRLSTWNTETISKKQKQRGQRISSCDRTKTTFQCGRCSRQISNSNDHQPHAAEMQRDYLDIKVTGEPHVDARLLGFNSVLKKYGHLPYNAPRVAICKAKSRPSGRLGVHRGFTYARLRQEISHALMELDESRQNFDKQSVAEDTLLNEDLKGKKSYPHTAYNPTENVTNDMSTPKEYGKITLQDFLLESKPKEARKKRRRVKKCVKNDAILECMSDSDNCLLLKDGRTSVQTLNNVSILRTPHPSPDCLIDWSVINDPESDNSFIWIDSDYQENLDSDDF